MNTVFTKALVLRSSRLPLSGLNTTELTAFGIINVRFRKRRDQPRRAPSKIYYVRQPTPKDPEEMAYLATHLNHYNTKIKSILSFLKSQKHPISSLVRVTDATQLNEQDDLERAFQLNDAWNAEIAIQRTARLAEESTAVQKIKDDKMTTHLKKLAMNQEQARKVIQATTERRSVSVDTDNLDDVIDEFLDRAPIDHNFAITGKGEEIRTD